MVASIAHRLSAKPPGGSAARMPTNALPGSGLARNANGAPTSCGATWVSTVNEPELVAPAAPMQPLPTGSPPTETEIA